jgi:GNAT superfamily N-acetyltransferase
MTFHLRQATLGDVDELSDLIERSVRKLQAPYYSEDQMNAALGPVCGVDRALITDGTYFAVESDRRIVGCGGWSRRQSEFGGDSVRIGEDPLLDPKVHAARIRAFFVDPEFARRGIGRMLLASCESAITEFGFATAELVATLAGVPLYRACGYGAYQQIEIPLSNGLRLPGVRMRKIFPVVRK